MPIKITLKSIFFIFLTVGLTNSQMLPNLAISGGPTVGWYFNNVNDLNTELTNAGFPEVSKNGYFTLGGGGFIDLPVKSSFIRIGGMGTGFNTNVEKKINDSLTKAVNYAFGMGGFSVEYVKYFGNFDISIGALFTTGTLKLDLYQYGVDAGNYNSVFNEFSNNSSSQNITINYKVRFYGAQPQIGLGLLLKKFIYLRLNAGYYTAAMGTWKVDNNVEVPNFPTGVKPTGFNINLGLNFGLFFRD
jgi:hypothetical protein